MEGPYKFITIQSSLMPSKDVQKLNISRTNVKIQNPDVIQEQLNNLSGSIQQQSKLYPGCANKLCKNHIQQSKSHTQQICSETLCTRCLQQFQKDSFCIYCKQIYFDETDDGKEWIMCEQCLRWVHTLCADFNTKQNPNAQFQCIKCRKIQALPNGRRNIPRTGYAKVQKKKNSQFLNTIGFQWQLTTYQVSQDMQNIRKYLG